LELLAQKDGLFKEFAQKLGEKDKEIVTLTEMSDRRADDVGALQVEL